MDGQITVSIPVLTAVLQVFYFKLKGLAMSSALSPDRIDFKLKGNIEIPLVYKESKKRGKKGHWSLGKNSKFNLVIDKSIKNALTFPDGLLNKLVKNVVPTGIA